MIIRSVSNQKEIAVVDIADTVRRFDHHDPQIMANPSETYRRMRAECPVGRSEAHDGFWVVSRYDDVVRVAGSPEQYCSGQGIAIPGTSSEMRVEPQEADGSRHRQIRKQMNSWFARSAVQELRPTIEALSASLLEERLIRTPFDLAVNYAVPLASITMLRMLGIPVEDEAYLRKNIDVLLHVRTADEGLVLTAALELYEYITGFITERSSGANTGAAVTEGLIDKITGVEIDGEPTSIDEQCSMILSLILAGLETSALAIASMAECLMNEPELRVRLASDPLLVPTAIDEFLRFTTPVQSIGRRVATETQLGEEKLGAGEQVMILYGSANRDPDRFSDPDEIILDRHPNAHLTFGYGVHRCLGRHVARLEMEVALEHLLNLPPFELAPAAVVGLSFGENRGVSSLPVIFGRAALDGVEAGLA